MLSILLRTAVFVGAGALLAGCDLFNTKQNSQSNSQTNNQTNPSPNQSSVSQFSNYCTFLRNSALVHRVENPVAEFNAFQRNRFREVLDQNMPSTLNGDFRQMNNALAPLFRDLGATSLSFYLGDDRAISSQNEIERLKSVEEYYASINATQLNAASPEILRNLVNGWHNDNLIISFRDVYLDNTSTSQTNPNHKNKTILTSVNFERVKSHLGGCIDENNPETARGIITSFEVR